LEKSHVLVQAKIEAGFHSKADHWADWHEAWLLSAPPLFVPELRAALLNSCVS
jgi:hypothetical protein